MAVKIPQYQERIGINGRPMPSMPAEVPRVAPTGLQNIGDTLMRAGGVLQQKSERDRIEAERAEAERLRAEQDQAQVWVAQAMPQFNLDRETDLTEMGRSAAPGAPEFARQYADRYNEQAKILREAAPSPSAKRLLDINLARGFEHYGMKALDFQKKEQVRQQIDLDTTAIQNASTVIYSDPAQFETMFGMLQAGIKNSAIYDQAGKEKALDILRKQTVNAAVVAWIDRHPGEAVATFEAMRNDTDANPSIRWSERGRTYEVPYKMGTLDERMHWMTYAQQKADSIRQEAQVGLQYEVQNAEAMARDGVAPTAPALGRDAFMAAYKRPEVAEHNYQRYITARKTAGQMAALKTAPSADLLGIMQATPDPKDKDYAVKSANLNIQQAAARQILDARAADPVQFAMQAGDFNFTPLDPSKPEFATELNKRSAALPVMTAKYGKAAVLSKNEAQLLTRRLDVLPADQKVQDLEKLRASLKDDAVYQSVMQAIRPDSPVTALVGNIAAVGYRDNARLIAAGEDLLNPTKADKSADGRGKFAMPKETDLRQAWVDAVGDAYRGFPDAELTAYQAFRAHYAAQAAARGFNDPNEGVKDDVAKAALTASTGGIMRWKTDWFGNDTPSANIVLPYGMAEDAFRDKVSAEWNGKRAGLGYSKIDVGDIGLQNTGANGEYMVMSGRSWLPGPDGRPVILRIK